MRKVMVDLFSGFGGASEAMKQNGWQVIRIDNEPRVKPDILADIRQLPIELPDRPLLVWASPPCTYYSRYDLMFHGGLFPNEPAPSLELWRASEAAIKAIDPHYWVIENVRGARRFHGNPCYRFRSYYIWTNIPMMLRPIWKYESKLKLQKGFDDPLRTQHKGYIPYPISDAIRLSIEAYL